MNAPINGVYILSNRINGPAGAGRKALSRSGFAINEKRINKTIIAGSDSVYIRGQGNIISIEQRVGLIGHGSIINVCQRVGVRSGGSAEVISIEQIVYLHTTGGGNLISIEQKVNNVASGSLINIEQRVYAQFDSSGIPHYFHRNGWQATLIVGGREIPSKNIGGMINVTRTESAAAIMSVTLINMKGSQSVDSYPGQRITLDIQAPSGTARVYTGVVDIPKVDIVGKTITLQCTDRRAEQLNKQLSVNGDGVTGTAELESIGYYSSLIFSTQKDVAGELALRLSTIPYAIDFDAYGNYNLTPWKSGSASFTLGDASVFYRSPTVELAQRGQAMNYASIVFQYRYPRLHHTARNFIWSTDAVICNIITYGFTLTSKALVASSINGAGWPLMGDILYTPIPASGFYGCGSIDSVAWSTVSAVGTTSPVTDVNGNPVLDSNGNPVTNTNTVVTDVGPLFCSSASWTATFRWSQTITETYTMLVQAPQSIAQYDKIKQQASYSAQSPFSPTDWDKYTTYTDTGHGTGSYHINEDINRADFDNAVVLVLNKTSTDILRTHRQNRVTIYRTLWPQIDLRHTVEVSTSTITAKGKVFTFSHDMNVSTGEAVTTVTLALSKANGSVSPSALIPPHVPTDIVNYDAGTIFLGNHFGENPSSTDAKSWTGFVGNSRPTPTGVLTTFPVSFVVDTPSLPPELTTEKKIAGGINATSPDGTYNVAIPDDLLEVVF